MAGGKPINEDDLLSSFNGDMFGVGNVASTINSKFGMGLDFDTKDFNTKHADDAVDFEDISLTDESDHEDATAKTEQNNITNQHNQGHDNISIIGNNDHNRSNGIRFDDNVRVFGDNHDGSNKFLPLKGNNAIDSNLSQNGFDFSLQDNNAGNYFGLGPSDFGSFESHDLGLNSFDLTNNNDHHDTNIPNVFDNLNMNQPILNDNFSLQNLLGISDSAYNNFEDANNKLFNNIFDNNHDSTVPLKNNFNQLNNNINQHGFQGTQNNLNKSIAAAEQTVSHITNDARPAKDPAQLAKEKLAREQREAERQRQLKEKEVMEDKLLKYYYPMFKKNSILKMHSLFRSVPTADIYYHYFCADVFKAPHKVLIPSKTQIELENDDRKLFNKRRKVSVASGYSQYSNYQNNSNNNSQKIIQITDSDYEFFRVRKQKSVEVHSDDYENDTILAAADWDDDMILGISNKSQQQSKPKNKITEITSGLDANKLLRYDEYQIDDDFEENILDGNLSSAAKINLKLDMNDPHLLFTSKNNLIRSRRGKANSVIPSNERLIFTKFNISNDKDYELLKENYHTKIRATIGNLIIDHSVPAMRLQSPYFKVKLTKQQMRSYHRPKFIVRSNTIMYFSKPKSRKKKKDKGKETKDIYSKTMDLTLGDTAPFYLLEYSEEYPKMLSNFGMGSKIINYYRKQTEDDTYRPKGLIGETHVLGVQDRSPFWNFGIVEKGKFVPTLYNQMVRAPVFQHDAESTDFLLLKLSGGTRQSNRYFLRSISKIFLVGQLYPVVEVPGPHSRKVTTVSKNRLKMIVYRVLNHNKKQRLSVKDISAHFPDQNDMQNRQRLKEFMVYQRTGEDQGYWKIKPNEKLPTEEEIRAMITPEDLCLLETMQVGQQHLEDYAIYSYDNVNLEKYSKFLAKFNAKGDPSGGVSNAGLPLALASNMLTNNGDAGTPGGKNSEEGDQLKGVFFEEQLAPWNTTRNFINATQGKAMLQLHGEGEPTGRREGISFLRTSMKGGFKALEDKDGNAKMTKLGGHSYNVALQQKAYDDEIKRTWNKQISSLSADEPLKYNRELNSKSRYNNRSLKVPYPPKVLRITRMVRNQYGVLERQVEVIKDERIINAYLMKKNEQYQEYLQNQSQQISQSIDLTNVKIPTNEDEKKILQQELEKLQAQKTNKKVLQSGKGIGKGKNTKRRCALCGAVGHIRTKKSCPMYGKVPNPDGTPKGGTSNTSSPAPSSAGNPSSPAVTEGTS